MYMPDTVINSNESMEEVAHKFQETRHYNIPVIDDGKYIGFVSRARISQHTVSCLRNFRRNKKTTPISKDGFYIYDLKI